LIWSFTKTTTPPPILPTLSRRNGDVWLEIKIKNKKYLYGTFYIPPNSNLQTWDELDQSIDLALNNTHDIIITGDFNINR
jgi:hypothetical protein